MVSAIAGQNVLLWIDRESSPENLPKIDYTQFRRRLSDCNTATNMDYLWSGTRLRTRFQTITISNPTDAFAHSAFLSTPYLLNHPTPPNCTRAGHICRPETGTQDGISIFSVPQHIPIPRKCPPTQLNLQKQKEVPKTYSS